MNETPPPFLAKIEHTLNRLLDPSQTMIFRPRRPTGPYASLNDRMCAAAIDLLWMMFLLGPVILQLRPYIYGDNNPLAMLANATSGSEIQGALSSGGLHLLLLEYFVSYLLMTPVLALMWGYASTTPGKWVMRLRIVDAQTLGKMSGRQMILRLAGYFIAIFPLGAGILWIACDKKKRGWQDYFASTAVIRVKHWRIRDDGVTPHLMDETAETPADISQDKAEQP